MELLVPLLPLSACIFCLFADHTLVGHDTSKAYVVDEFECLQKCFENRKCKSLNLHPSGNKSEFICELNNKARQMTPDAFQRKQGSSYYGSVEASDYDHLEKKDKRVRYMTVFELTRS